MNNSALIDPSKFIRHLHVAEDVIGKEYTQEILEKNNLPYTVIPSGEFPSSISGFYPLNLSEGKKHLFLCDNKGHFFKPCPGTLEYKCCDYHVLNIGMNCPMDCVYCILQAYLDKPWITAFVNIEKLFQELDEALTVNNNTFFRIGTGEFTDSMAFDRITGLNKKLVEFMASYDNVILELKTKCGYINPLEGANHNGKTILSWSLNSELIVNKEELRAAPLQQRLAAARKGAEWGYGLGFHFDPIVHHQGWKDGYKATIDMLFQEVPRDSIAWISLGALRYLPRLKDTATSRFPHSNIFFNEFITGLDGKSRYFRTQREEMYSYIYHLLEKYIATDTCVYFCMESDEVWRKVMGYSPETKGGIAAMLDSAARKSIAKY